jgi:hypothetical protein
VKLHNVRRRQWRAYIRHLDKHGASLHTATFACRWSPRRGRRHARYIPLRKPWEATSWHPYCRRYHDYDAPCWRLTREHGEPTSSADLAYGRLSTLGERWHGRFPEGPYPLFMSE